MNDPRDDDPDFKRKDFAGAWIGTASAFIFRRRKPLLWLFILITIVLAAWRPGCSSRQDSPR